MRGFLFSGGGAVLHKLRKRLRPGTLCKRRYACTKIRAHGISLCENNLNQPVCSSFFSLLCLVASFSQLRCADFFVCFWGSWFCTPAINQTSVSQSKGWFSFVLLCRREKYHWKVSLDLHIIIPTCDSINQKWQRCYVNRLCSVQE